MIHARWSAAIAACIISLPVQAEPRWGPERVQTCYELPTGELGGVARTFDTGPSRAAGFTVPRNTVTVETLLDNGPSDQRLDIVFVGDGYTADELELYHADVDAHLAALLEIEPYKTYRTHLNIHRVDVVSNESGVDHDPSFGIERDTALDGELWCGGIQRSLCVDSFKARTYAALAPGDEHVIAIANSASYGGAAFFGTHVATATARHPSSHAILHHELGHSLFTLEDEYDTGGPRVYSGPEWGRANLSIHDESAQIDLQTKWWDLMGVSLDGFDGPTGAFEGGGYSRRGIYRPSPNSIMRNLNRPFNLVGLESGIRALHQFDDDFLPLIDGATEPFLGTFHGHSSEFFIEPLHPATHQLRVSWLLDGEPLGIEGVESLKVCELQLQPGAYVLVAKVVDETPWVLDEDVRFQSLTATWAWRLVIDTAPGDRTGDRLLNMDDVADFAEAYLLKDPSADLAEPWGTHDAVDIDAFVERFLYPCGIERLGG